MAFRLFGTLLLISCAVLSTSGLSHGMVNLFPALRKHEKTTETEAPNADTFHTATSINEGSKHSNDNVENFDLGPQVDWTIVFLCFSVVLVLFMTCRYVFNGITESCRVNQQTRRRQRNSQNSTIHRIIDYTPAQFDNMARSINYVVSQRVLMSRCKQCTEEIDAALIGVGSQIKEEQSKRETPPPPYIPSNSEELPEISVDSTP